MLAVIDPEGRRAGHQAVLYGAALVPVSLLPTLVGIAGALYFASALVLSVALLVLAARFGSTRSETSARALFFGSIAYLPLIWIIMIADRW